MSELSRAGQGSVRVSLTDTALVARLLDHDVRALALIYQRHGPRVIAVANAVLQDRTAAEEVCQDVFVQLWHQPQEFDGGPGTLRAHLVVVSHGRALDRRRSEQAPARREEQDGDLLRSGRGGPDDLASASSTATEIWATVNALPVHEADALRLAYFSGPSYWKVARILGVAEGTAKSRIRSGLLRLRATLVEQGTITAS